MDVQKQIISNNTWHYYLNLNDPQKFIEVTQQAITEQNKQSIDKIAFFFPKTFEPYGENAGLLKEAEIKGYFNGVKPIVCYSSFLDNKNSTISKVEKNVISGIIGNAKRAKFRAKKYGLDNRYKIQQLQKNQLPDIKDLINKLFPDPKLNKLSVQQLEENINDKIFFGVFYHNQLTICCSVLLTNQTKTASIQDFYFDKNFKDLHNMYYLLDKTVNDLMNKNIKTVYSFTRSLDPDLNRLFGIYGFNHGGTLVNETEVTGNVENLNLWFKNLKRNMLI